MNEDNGTDVSSYKVWAFRDRSGLTCIGKVHGDVDDPIAVLKDPLFMIEGQARTEDPRTATINFSFRPILHTYHVEQIDIEWISKFPAPADLVRDYENTWSELRAKRSGIITSSNIPGIRAAN